LEISQLWTERDYKAVDEVGGNINATSTVESGLNAGFVVECW
jgi:hypothetical protein